MKKEQHITFTYDLNTPNRLDKILAQKLASYSREVIKKWIEGGYIKVNGTTYLTASTKIKLGDTLHVIIKNEQPNLLQGESIGLSIVFEDEYILVLNKPPHLVVHPSPGHDTGTLVHALIAHCGESILSVGDPKRPGIVHRLDKDTTGLMVVAKTQLAYEKLSYQFQHKQDNQSDLQRIYYTLVYGIPSSTNIKLENYILRDPKTRKKKHITQT